MRILISKILDNVAIASAAVSEDKHHNMRSFKAADCTVKLYLTTSKIILQGPGSSNLTKALSDWLENVSEDKADNNGDQHTEALTFESAKSATTDVSDALNDHVEPCSCLPALKPYLEELIKCQISNLSNGGDIVQSESQDESEDAVCKLHDENNELRSQVRKLKETITILENEKSTLIATIGILQLDLKRKEGVHDIPENVSTTEAVMQSSCQHVPEGVTKPSAKQESKPKATTSAKKKGKSSAAANNSRNERGTKPSITERVVILGDSTIKGLQWWKMSRDAVKVGMREFRGATIEHMESYTIPTVHSDPSEIILHTGTNDLPSKSPRQVAENIINLADDISQNTTAKVTISGLTHRTDDPVFKNKVTETNKILKSFLRSRDMSFIDNRQIDSSMLNKSGLQNAKGSTALAKNILDHIYNSD